MSTDQFFYGYFTSSHQERPSFIVIATEAEINSLELKAKTNSETGIFMRMNGYRSIAELEAKAEKQREKLMFELESKSMMSLLGEEESFQD